MEKNQLLFPQNNERSVSELRDLGSNEEPGPEGRDLVGGEVAGVADGLLHAAAEEGVEELGEGAGEPDDGEGGEASAPSSKSSSQLDKENLAFLLCIEFVRQLLHISHCWWCFNLERGAGVHESLAREDKDEIECAGC